MNLYMVEFDATTYIVTATDEDELFDLLHQRDSSFQKEVDKGIVYMWDLQNIESVEVTQVDQEVKGILFSVSH